MTGLDPDSIFGSDKLKSRLEFVVDKSNNENPDTNPIRASVFFFFWVGVGCKILGK